MSLCAQINEGRDVTYSPTGQGKNPDWRSGNLGLGEQAVPCAHLGPWDPQLLKALATS